MRERHAAVGLLLVIVAGHQVAAGRMRAWPASDLVVFQDLGTGPCVLEGGEEPRSRELRHNREAQFRATESLEDALRKYNLQDVWASDFEKHFEVFSTALSQAARGQGAGLVAVDTEFPGFTRELPLHSSLQDRFQAVRENVRLLKPIQVGIALADEHGVPLPLSAWNFNLQFSLERDMHIEKSIVFLKSAGVDFQRHAAEGLDARRFGRRLDRILRTCAGMGTGGVGGLHLVTFAGLHDLGFLLKLLADGADLPAHMADFDWFINFYFSARVELQELLPPFGSLNYWADSFWVPRIGRAHTAGSDALVTLRLYLRVAGSIWNQATKSMDGFSTSSLQALGAEVIPGMAEV